MATPDVTEGIAQLTINGITLIVDRQLMSDGDIDAIRRGKWEAGEYAMVRSTVRAGDRVIELGACLGYISMTIAGIVGADKVFSFEANPAPIAAARQNFSINDLPIELSHGIMVNRLNYSGAGQQLTFYVSNAVVSSSLLPGHGKATPVPAFCLEDEIIRRRCNVLVMDIEGGEVDLLCGADLTFVDKIIMETHYRKAGRQEVNRMIRYLYSQGFVIDLATSRGEVIYMHRGLTDAPK